MSRDVLRTMRGLSLAVVTATAGLALLVPGAAQAQVRVGENYRLNSDPSPFRGKDQVSLAVNPRNPQHIVEVNADYLTDDCEGTASFDGGITWSNAVALSPPATSAPALPFVASCRVSNHAGETMFQTLAFGTGNNVYATSIVPRAAGFGETGASTLIYKSADGGLTWGRGVEAMRGGPGNAGTITPANGPSYELPTLAVDPGAGPGGADRVYVAARETTGFENSGPPCPRPVCGAARTAVSDNGGLTFSSGVNASPVGVPVVEASQPVVNGNFVSVTWRTFGTAGTIQASRSNDQAKTWSGPVTVTNVTGGGRPNSSHVTPLPAAASTFPRLAGDGKNDLYLVYNQGPPGPTGTYTGTDHFIDPDLDVYFQRSLNNGQTWSTPKPINDATAYPGSQTTQTRHPNVTVAPNGRLDIVWEDRRHWYQGPGERNCVHTHLLCDDARLGDTYYVNSTDRGASFSPNRRISDKSHNNDVGFDYRFATYWAFGPVSAPIGNDQLIVGWMDSQEGSFDTDNQDIYLAKVNVNGASAVSQSYVNQPDAVSRSVALSKFAYEGGGNGLLASTFASRNGTRVVIANQGDVPGALAGGVLARANLAPVLLSPSAGLPANVQAEVSRLEPVGAYVIGDTGKLSANVVANLVAAGISESQIVRVNGDSDPATAAQVAAQFDRRSAAEKTAGSPAFDAAVIVNPASPEAAAASALAAARRLPILYVGTDAIPMATRDALTSLNISSTLVVGGPQSVSATVLSGLPAPKRLGGGDQYAVSQAVAAESQARGLPSNVTYVADGSAPMDAALLGAAVGRTTGIMVLAKGPLHATASGTASAAGLGGIDQLVVLGPPPPAAPGPPPVVTPPVVKPVIPPAVGPKLTGVSLTRTVFRVGPRATALSAALRPIGTTFRFSLSKAAKVRMVISRRGLGRRVGRSCVRATRALRKRKPCLRVIKIGILTRSRLKGASRIAFSGRIGRRALTPGRYQVAFRATDAGGRTSARVVRPFQVVRR